MTLIKRTNNHSPSISGWMNDFFNDDFFKLPQHGKKMNGSIPAVNILQNDSGYNIELAVPGKSKEDFQIELNDNVMCISSESKQKTAEENDNFTRKEFSYESFKRYFTLPESVDQENIAAKYENGILRIVIPKAAEKKSSVKQIEIS